MKIFVEKENKLIEKTFEGIASSLLTELDIILEDVLIIRNGELVTEDEFLNNDDEIKLLSVISGG